MLAAVASPLCSAAQTATAQSSQPGSSASQGCTDTPLTNRAVRDAGCGEDVDCLSCDYKVLDVHALFDSVAGDKPIFPCLKDQQVGGLKYSVGAELRYRYMHEQNRLRPGGPGQSGYDLWRFTPYLQANYNDFIGGYVQAIDASMFGLDAPYSPTVIDINRMAPRATSIAPTALTRRLRIARSAVSIRRSRASKTIRTISTTCILTKNSQVLP